MEINENYSFLSPVADRLNYGDLLRPSPGFVLVKAIGTTYSLDLFALLQIYMSLGLSVDTDSGAEGACFDSLYCLKAIKTISDKIVVFCEAGQIKVPSKASHLFSLIEKNIVPVSLPKDNDFYPAFHPKTWIIEYINSKGDKEYKFIVLSRNLTFDKSWDVAVQFIAITKKKQNKSSKKSQNSDRIVSFLSFLKCKVNKNERARKIIEELILSLDNLEFKFFDNSLNGEKNEINFEIIPILGCKSIIDMNQEELLDGDVKYNKLLAVSPFVSYDILSNLNSHVDEKQSDISNIKRVLITRKAAILDILKDNLDQLGYFSANDVNESGFYEVNPDICDNQPYAQESDNNSSKSFNNFIEAESECIHAKIFAISEFLDASGKSSKKSLLYIGSMNASKAAISNNVEMMVKLSSDSIDFYNQLMTDFNLIEGKEDKTNNINFFSKIQLNSQYVEESNERKIDRILENFIKTVCDKASAKIEKKDEYSDLYQIVINLENIDCLSDSSKEFSLNLLNESKEGLLQEKAYLFEDVKLINLGEFYIIKVKDKESEKEVSRVIKIDTEWNIKDFSYQRDKAIYGSLLSEKGALLNFLQLYLTNNFECFSAKKSHKNQVSSRQLSYIHSYTNLYEQLLKLSVTDNGNQIKELIEIARSVESCDKDAEALIKFLEYFDIKG